MNRLIDHVTDDMYALATPYQKDVVDSVRRCGGSIRKAAADRGVTPEVLRRSIKRLISRTQEGCSIDVQDTGYDPFATKRQKQVLDMLRENGCNYADAASSLGVSEQDLFAVLGRLRSSAAKRGYSPDFGLNRPVPEGLALSGVSDMRENELGKPIWYKYSKSQIRAIKEVEIAVESMIQDLPRAQPSTAEHTSDDLDLIPWFQIGDAHIGMLAHDVEVGHNFDLKIAERELVTALSIMIDRAPLTNRCVIQDLGDMTHYENYSGTTEQSGHAVDYDTRFHKMIKVYGRTMRAIVEKALSKYENVDVIINQGNHSRTNDHWMAELLSQVYENEPRLNVLNNGCVFIPYRMGNTFVLCHHTDKCKPSKLAGVMANDFPQDWGETTYHYIDGGHVHHNQVTKEENGAVFRSYNQLAPADKYAHDGGWRSRSLLTTVLRSKTYGETGTLTLTAEEVKDRILNAAPGTSCKVRRKVYTV